LPHRLIILPSASVINLGKMLADACAPGMLRGADLGSLVVYLAASYAKSLVVTLRELRNDLAVVEALLDAEALTGRALREKNAAGARVQGLWPQVTGMLDLVDDQAFVVRTLRELKLAALDLDPHRDYLDDLAADSDHVFRVAGRLETRYRLLGERLESLHAAASERRLRVLTIISAVFLPLTLITGYFGMNFVDMPLLVIPNATIILVTLMLALTAGLMLYFRRAHWL
jgi:Mg2+ and Co2+ transporter CorA